MNVFVWTTGIGDFLHGHGATGGITVQLYFWCRILHVLGFTPWTLSTKNSENGGKNGENHAAGIRFFHLPQTLGLGPLLEAAAIFRIVFCLRPAAVFLRGATRSLFLFALLGKITRVRIVFFLANDDDPVPGHELIARAWDRVLYRAGLRLCRWFVCQNTCQQERLAANYGKRNTLLIPNIWLPPEHDNAPTHPASRTEILWVSNLRRLKRPAWFLHLAEQFPAEHFTMTGGPYETACYQEAEQLAASLPNVTFCGRKSFAEIETLFASSKLLVCTSEVEGFPNTFLQAWSRGLPILSTVDPGGVIAARHLGAVADSPESLMHELGTLLKDSARYQTLSTNAAAYFQTAYNAEASARTLCTAIGLKLPPEARGKAVAA